MENLILIAIEMMLVNNFLLSQFLGLCPFFGITTNTKNALGLGLSISFVMIITSGVAWIVYKFLLVPFHLEFMQVMSFILVIAALVQFVEFFVRKKSQALYNALGVFLPLITVNSVVLGIALLNVQKNYSLIGSLVSAAAGGAGYTIALLMMSGIRERMELADVPKPLKGMPIAFIIAALMSIGFLGFAGMLR